MAHIQGIHLLAKGGKSEARRIAEDIRRYQRLLVGTGSAHGAGAYAWYKEHLPRELYNWPQVLFEVEESSIAPICNRDGASRGYFRIPGVIGSYVRIHVLAFANLD